MERMIEVSLAVFFLIAVLGFRVSRGVLKDFLLLRWNIFVALYGAINMVMLIAAVVLLF